MVFGLVRGLRCGCASVSSPVKRGGGFSAVESAGLAGEGLAFPRAPKRAWDSPKLPILPQPLKSVSRLLVFQLIHLGGIYWDVLSWCDPVPMAPPKNLH